MIGIKGWFEYGTDVKKHLTSDEAIKAAKLDYEVVKKPLFLSDGTTVPTHFATVRTDTDNQLGVVGSRYTILQNKSGLSFLDGIVGIKDAIYESAGAFRNGAKVWLLAKLPGYIKTVGEDITNKYLLLHNSHDGSGSVQIMFTPIRVVCANTLNVAIGAATNRISLRHTQNIGEKITKVQQQLGIINQRFSIFEEASQKLATVDLTKQAFEDYVKNTGLIPKKEDDEQSTRAQNILDEVSELFEVGRGAKLKGVKGTAWGAFNAVAEYVDHYRGVSEKNKDLPKQSKKFQEIQSKSTESLLFGSGSVIKQKAWNAAISLAL